MRPLLMVIKEFRVVKSSKEKLEIREGILLDELMKHRDFKKIMRKRTMERKGGKRRG